MSKISRAIVRPIPNTITNGLSLGKSKMPINVDCAKREHQNYTNLLKSFVEVHEIPIANDMPDSTFVEDTVLIANKKILINNMGAPIRRQETNEIKKFFQINFKGEFELYDMIEKCNKATLDGGDVLYIPTLNTFFVGISLRTNEYALNVIQQIWKESKVIPIKVIKGLHLKSFITLLGVTKDNIVHLVVADDDIGINIVEQMSKYLHKLKFHYVPNVQMANVICINNNIVAKNGFPNSKLIFDKLDIEYPYEFKFHYIAYNEVEKIDGALTCCSVLF